MIEEGCCFACREKGHLSSQCPKKEHGGTRKATTKGKMRMVKEDDEMSSRSSSPPPPPLSPPKYCRATKPSTSIHCTTTEDEGEEQETHPDYTRITCIRMKALKKSLK